MEPDALPAPLQSHAEALAEELQSGRRILICGEPHPDPDCAGSQIALRRIFKARCPDLHIALLNEQGPPEDLLWLRDAKRLRQPKDKDRGADLAICVDGGIERCGPQTQAVLETARRQAIIDHHAVGSARSYDISLVDASFASTTALITTLAQGWGARIDAAAAQALYTGLIADTGSFQYASTTARTLRIGALLVEAGADPATICERARLRRPVDDLSFQARVFAGLERRGPRGEVLIARIEREHLAGLELGPLPAERIIRSLNHLDGIAVTVVLKDGPAFRGQPGAAPWRRLSFRSAAPVDVAVLARALDPEGGGHARAAGCRMEGEDEAIVARVLEALGPQLGGA